MACGDELSFNVDYDSGLEIVDDRGCCIPPSQFDAMVDYTSETPFHGIDSKTAGGYIVDNIKIKLQLTFNQYVSCLEKKKKDLKQIFIVSVTGDKMIPSGEGYTDSKNSYNNPLHINISGRVINSFLKGFNFPLNYKGNEKVTRAPNMEIGTAFCMWYLITKCNGMNICQIYNTLYSKISFKKKEIDKGVCIGNIALDLIDISRICSEMKLNEIAQKPDVQLNLKDEGTLFALIYGISLVKTKVKFQEGFINRCYETYKKIFVTPFITNNENG